MNHESAYELQPGQKKIERHLGYAEEMVLRQDSADFNNSLSRDDMNLYKQRQIDPPLRWGDEQPNWEERLTVTVGPKDADIVGADQRAIQAAIDYVARLGGGNVRIHAGTYRLRNAVYLQAGVNLIGDGTETILIKEPSATSGLAVCETCGIPVGKGRRDAAAVSGYWCVRRSAQ